MGGGEGTDGDIGWAEQLEREYTNRGIKPEGEGWMTFHQVHAEMPGGVVKVRKIIKDAVDAGRLEVFKGSSKSTATGQLCRQVWYRPKS